MSSFEELRNIRIQKLKLLEKAGMDPYPAISKKDYSIFEVINDFDKISKKGSIHLCGRVMAVRGQGGLVFININDGTGTFQGLLKKDEMDEKVFDLFQNTTDIGDFIEINGKLFVTKRGEKTLQVDKWKMLTKSLRPLPEKWHGIQDEEDKLRKRYLDIIFNQEVKESVEKRAKFFSSMRQFLADKDFMEVDTPDRKSVV
jgi:lysyl-tRNA synthetase, class II